MTKALLDRVRAGFEDVRERPGDFRCPVECGNPLAPCGAKYQRVSTMVRHISQTHTRFWGHLPPQLRGLLQQRGLRVSSTHYFTRLWECACRRAPEFPLPDDVSESDTVDVVNFLPVPDTGLNEDELLPGEAGDQEEQDEESSADEYMAFAPGARHLPERQAKHKPPLPPASTPPSSDSGSPPESPTDSGDADFALRKPLKPRQVVPTGPLRTARLVLSSGGESPLSNKRQPRRTKRKRRTAEAMSPARNLDWTRLELYVKLSGCDINDF